MRRVLIAGRYRLLESIGSGGMGHVWLARDEMLHRDVAVKEVRPPGWLSEAERDELRRRTLREARTAARLSHPNVVRIYDVVFADGTPWIVMEHVRSRSLHEVVETGGPLPPARVAAIGLALLDALCAAHARGVLHRDVKPHNVLVGDDGRVVLTDFGLATVDGDSAVTRAGMVMGSPQYVAPERAADGTSTVEADLWSLGATLYAAVEGRSPYQRRTTLATLTALATEPPDPVRLAGPLRPVLLGLLRRDPRQRLGADEVDRLLRRVVDPTMKPRPRVLPRPRRAATAGATVPLAGRRLRAGSSARRWAAVAAAGVLVVVAAAAGTAWALGREPPPGPSRASPASAPPGDGGPCDNPAAAVTDPVSPGPTPAGERFGLLPFFTWHTAPAGYRVPAPVGWRTYEEGTATCFHDTHLRRTMSVEALPAPVADPVAHWRGATAPPGYTDGTVTRSYLFDGGAEWEFTYTPAGEEPRRALRILYNCGPRAYVITWTAPAIDWNPALLPTIRLGFRPPDWTD